MIDEPGAGAAIGPGGGLPQRVCQVSSAPTVAGAGPGGCTTTIGTHSSGYVGAIESGGTVPNVFPGVVNNNVVSFNGIPIVAPVTAGSARWFRITNIRANVNALATTGFQGNTPVVAFVAISSGIPLSNPQQTVGFVYDGMNNTNPIRNLGNSNNTSSMINLPQCGTTGLTAGAVLRFTEGFASAFKTRVAPGTSNQSVAYSGAMTSSGGPIQGNTVLQNIPAQVLPGSESGFVLQMPASGGGGAVAGLADFGTRLKATFTGIPAGITVFVSTTNINLGGGVNTNATFNTSISPFNKIANLTPGDAGTSSIAALITSETAPNGPGGFLPLQANTNNSGGNLLYALQPDSSGNAVAVWEVVSANPTGLENFEFSVYYAYVGDPANNRPPTSPAGTVALSFAPTFSSPTTSTGIVPRFAPSQTSAGTLISVAACQTVLLYPFVSNEGFFETGLAIANTTTDPFGTRAQNGTCDLYWNGVTASKQTVPTGTGATIKSGEVWAESVTGLNKTGFRGYVIAVCNFQLAHGYALVSDTGIRNWATGYLALVIHSGTAARNPGTLGALNETLGN
jgi:hypothetical protein